jgi:metaxin
VADLDRGLSATQRAEATAFTALLEGKLQPALVYSTWCEDEAFAQHTRGAVAAALPFPLSQLVPRLQRRAVQQYFAARSSDDVYQGAADALDALALRLETGGSGSKGGGGFFFGSRPSTIDALLYACLAYVHAAPVVHPQLRQKLDGHRSLVAYLERCSQRAFSAGAPAAAEASFDFTAWASSQAADDK